MASRRTTSTNARRQSNREISRGMYVDGNTVRKPQELPERRRNQAAQQRKARAAAEAQRKPRTASQARAAHRQVQKNRAKAEGISRGFIIFLTVVCIALLPVAIQYLQLKSEITSSKKQVAILESELTSMKEENDAYYSQVTNNVDMSKIKKIAIGRLGMKYPTDDQMETYQTARSSYVRQYQELPDSR